MRLRFTMAALLLSCWSSAHAVYTISILETGGNVVMTGSGSINTTGMVSSGSNVCNGATGVGAITPDVICVGPGTASPTYGGVVSPAVSGLTSGGTFFADSYTGVPVFVARTNLILPTGYTSGAPLANSSTYNGKTFASLGLTPGTRTFSLTSGDTIVIHIGPVATVAVPTVGAYGLMALASLLAMAGTLATRRRQR
jgi:hypothetical protein